MENQIKQRKLDLEQLESREPQRTARESELASQYQAAQNGVAARRRHRADPEEVGPSPPPAMAKTRAGDTVGRGEIHSQRGRVNRNRARSPLSSPTVDLPRKLKWRQVKEFNEHGYLADIRIFGREEIDAIRAYFDELLAKTLAAGGDSYSISTAHLRRGRIYGLLAASRLWRAFGTCLART